MQQFYISVGDDSGLEEHLADAQQLGLINGQGEWVDGIIGLQNIHEETGIWSRIYISKSELALVYREISIEGDNNERFMSLRCDRGFDS